MGEHLVNRFISSSLLFSANGDVYLESFGIPIWHSKTKGIGSSYLRVTNDGRIEIGVVPGTAGVSSKIIGNNIRYPTGAYTMAVGVQGLFVVNSANVVVSDVFNLRLDLLWNNVASLYMEFFSTVPSNAVNVYLPDSGFDSFYNFRFNTVLVNPSTGMIVSNTSLARPTLFQNFSSDPTYHDFVRHGTQEVMLISSDTVGTAPNTDVFVMKITNGTSSRVREPDVVRSIRAAFTHVTAKPKVINLSLSFGCDWPQTIKCAMQWAYKAGIVVVAAAGNNNTRCDSQLQYAFVVGAVYGSWYERNGNTTVLQASNFGTMIDGWALGNMQDPINSGSSYATAIVSGAAAHAMRLSTSLRNNPGLVFSYLRLHSDFRMSISQTKVILSSLAPRGVVRSTKLRSVPSTTQVRVPYSEFCTTITGAGLPIENPTATHWNTLVARAYASNRNGSLVTDSVYDVNARVVDSAYTP
jgi:hypothetical protein